MKFITQTFIRGLVVFLPIAAAIYVLILLGKIGEAWIRDLILLIIPEKYYVPGMGLILTLGIVFGIGILMYPWVTRKFFAGADQLLRKIPLFKLIYSPTRDLMNILGGDIQQELGQAVLVQIPNLNIKALGFITGGDLSYMSESFAHENYIVVFVPWSYQFGGYCFIVPRDAVEPVDMTIEQGLRWSMTAGISMASNDAAQEKQP